MASYLLLAGIGSGPDDRWSLDERDEDNLAVALRELVPYTAEPDQAALVHERDGATIAAWDREGALRLAELLPPAYADLSNALVRPYASQ